MEQESYCCRVMGRVERLSCEHMDGLQTKQTRWFSLRESECSKHGTGYILQGCRITARVDQDMLDGRVPAWLDGRHLAGTMKEEEE
jgi:hypothetical protein